MKETKFRAWTGRRMAEVVELHFFAEEDDETEKGILTTATIMLKDGKTGTVPIEELTLIQYTGLKDKNGEEIYEGHIVKFKGKAWDSDGTYSEPMRMEYVRFENGTFYAPNMYEEDCYEIGWNEVEIIGNIYENPNLLSSP